MEFSAPNLAYMYVIRKLVTKEPNLKLKTQPNHYVISRKLSQYLVLKVG